MHTRLDAIRQELRRLLAEGNLPREAAQNFSPRPFEQLFDSETDPDEVHNLATKSEYRGTVERLSKQLQPYVRLAAHKRS